MNSKWYASTLFLLLFILFGAFQEKGTTPNQEIVLEFVDTQINKKNIENTISDIKEKLLDVGVENIVIQETKDGTLTISYFSTFNVQKVKEALAKQHLFALHKKQDKNQNNNSSSKYNIDIHELTNETNISSLEDKFIFEIKYSSDRFTTNNTLASLRNLEVNKANQLYKTAYKTNKNNLFFKDHTSHKEPEVRAGPNYYKI